MGAGDVSATATTDTDCIVMPVCLAYHIEASLRAKQGASCVCAGILLLQLKHCVAMLTCDKQKLCPHGNVVGRWSDSSKSS